MDVISWLGAYFVKNEVYEKAMQFFERERPIVLHIGLSDEVAKDRLSKRHREDDTTEGIEERLRWSHQEAAAVNEWFKNSLDYRFVEINGEQPIVDVQKEILAALELL